MTTSIKRFQLEREISDIIKNDNNCSVHFEWKDVNVYINNLTIKNKRLDLITYNPVHNNFFLLHSIQNAVENFTMEQVYVTLLESMLIYVKKRQQSQIHYAIDWNYKTSTQSAKISYFRGKDMKDILNKFYYEKDIDTIVIYSITMIAES